MTPPASAPKCRIELADPQSWHFEHDQEIEHQDAELFALRALIRHLPHCDQVHNMGCSTLDELFKRAAALREGGT